MNMPTLSPASPVAPAIEPPPINLAPRRLADDVFQSAEEAVLVEGQADPFADVQPSGTASGTTRRNPDGRRAFSLNNAIRSHVAARPCQSALLAAAAGALAVIVLRSQLRGRFARVRPSWLRSNEAMRPRR